MTARDIDIEPLEDEIYESEKFIYDIKMEYKHPKKCLAEEKIDE